MPSQSTRVREAPVDPRARNETPCVVGFAATLDERRNRLKPGTVRKRSSRLTPGVCRSSSLPKTEIDAGVSVFTFSATVIEVRTGSSFAGSVSAVAAGAACGVCARSGRRSDISGADNANIRGNLGEAGWVLLFGEENLIPFAIMDDCRSFRPGRNDGSKILQDTVYIAFRRGREFEVLCPKQHRYSAAGETPAEECRTLHRAFEPVLAGGVEIEVKFHLFVVVASELADLRAAGVRGGFPVDEARAFTVFIGTNAIEVVTAPAELSLDVAFEIMQQVFECGLRIEARVDQNLVRDRDFNAALREAEWEAGTEQEAVIMLGAALGEEKFDGCVETLASWDAGKVAW
jgi:hypothetical protein